ncbi:ATP-grasp fold amidoligase family protein [Helicobacter fennelliae]|uniref:ATP-grasp fold amidoligase family protein n=2 Tax=Helicobacter TaxID=209 RepID=UPI000DFF7EB5|nr:ATP-grasp fold amidoligase family protein [Helicobacter fennelliae]STQ84593.1 putative glycosyltransferase [Helicobacter fennelliae]
MLLYLLILWGGGQSKSNALDSKHSNLSDSVSYSNHLESLHKVDSATFNSNSLDSLNSNYSNLSNHLESTLSNSNSLDSSFNSKQTQCNSKLNSKLDSKYFNHLESLHKVDSATFNSNSLDSLNSNYSNLSNHLDSKNLDSVSNLSDSNSLDSINLHSIDSATLSLLFMPIDDIQDKLFETNTCEFLPKIYGIYKNVEEIDFTLLPQSFVLKTNHDCGGVVLVQDKDEFLNNKKVFQESMDKLRKHLNTNYYTKTREWHYDSIEPRVFVEEMISDNGRDPATYKFHIFKSSQESYIQLTTDRFTNYKRIILDSNWNLAPFGFVYDNAKNDIPTKPKNLSMLQNIASILAQPFGYVRVDLYNANECIMVGELTFTHGGGTEKVVPNEWDTHLGNLWKYIYFSSCYAESKNDSK